MGYYPFMGISSQSDYIKLGGTPPNLPLHGAHKKKEKEVEKSEDTFTNGEEKTPKKSGLRRYFEGIKNGAVKLVTDLFTVNGALITAATIGLVAATGGAALMPLALLGMGVGAFQFIKGAINKNPEAMGEGTVTLLASGVGAKIAPKTLGGETLANTSLWGKIKAPFGGKGTYVNPEATYYSASKQATLDTFHSVKSRFTKNPTTTQPEAPPIELEEDDISDGIVPEDSASNAGSSTHSEAKSKHTARGPAVENARSERTDHSSDFKDARSERTDRSSDFVDAQEWPEPTPIQEPNGTWNTAPAPMQSPNGAWNVKPAPIQAAPTHQNIESWVAASEGFPEPPPGTVPEIPAVKTSNISKTSQKKNGIDFDKAKSVASSTPPSTSSNGNNSSQNTNGAADASFSDKAKGYWDKITNSPHLASTWLGPVFAAPFTKTKAEKEALAEEARSTNSETTYY